MDTINKRIMTMAELGRVIADIRKHQVFEQIIVMGDFNTPAITWSYDEDEPGTLTNSNSNITPADSKLLLLTAQHRLSQINNITNRRGTFLDLCFTSRHQNCKILRPPMEELLDIECMSHKAIELIISFDSNNRSSDDKKIYTFTEKTNKIRRIVNSTHFEWFLGDEMSTASPDEITQRISTITNKWHDILQGNCVRRMQNLPKDLNTHAWGKDKNYRRLFTLKQEAKKTYLIDQSHDNKEALKIANIKHYNQLKINYHQKLINNTSGDASEFYSVMKNRSKANSSLPIVMYNNERQFIGSARFNAIASQLESAFTKDDTFSADSAQKIEQIYEENYDDQYIENWNEYSDSFTLGEVVEAIKSLNLKTDTGPMLISAQFIKNNLDVTAPFLTKFFNAILLSGIIPLEWKKSFIVPIPKKGRLSNISNYRGNLK